MYSFRNLIGNGYNRANMANIFCLHTNASTKQLAYLHDEQYSVGGPKEWALWQRLFHYYFFMHYLDLLSFPASN